MPRPVPPSSFYKIQELSQKGPETASSLATRWGETIHYACTRLVHAKTQSGPRRTGFNFIPRLPAKRKPILDLGPRGGLRAAFSRGLEIHRAAKVSGEMFRYTKEFRDAIGSLRIDRFDLSGHNADIRRYATDSFWLNEAAAGTRGRLSGPARPLRGTRRHGSLLNTNPVEAGSMERRRGMVKNDGTADSKERRHNGNG